DGERAFGARGEADRRRGVPVRHGPVAGLEHGEGADQVLRRDGLAPEGRVGEDERAAFDVLDAHLARRALGERLKVAPAPVHRRVLRPGPDRRDALVAVPQRMDVGALERLDQRRIATHQLLSTDAEPGPLTTMYNIAPISARFFRKWLIWLTRCAGSYSQNRCAMPVAITT